jgi:NADH-quinone oxidoreductase subunit J
VSFNGETILFVVLSLCTLVGAVLTVTRRNPVTAVMSLVFTFFTLAGLYATLDAHFVAVLQILVYAGAIMVLFIFVVMILNREEVSPISFKGILTRLLGVAAGGYVAWVGGMAVWNARGTPLLAGPTGVAAPDYGTVATVGSALFRDFVLPFEAISLLLLVAIVGGVIVSRSAHTTEQAEERARHLDEIRHQAHPAMRLLPGGRQVEEGADEPPEPITPMGTLGGSPNPPAKDSAGPSPAPSTRGAHH